MSEHLGAIDMAQNYQRAEIACEICGSNDLSPLQARGRIAEAGVYGPLPIAICRVCGFVFQNPRYEARFYQDYYRSRYREVAFGAAKPSQKYIDGQVIRGGNVMEYCHGFVTPPGKMLDHGCASGATMIPFKDGGWDAYGIDPHEPSVRTGIEDLGLDIRVAGGEAVPFDDGFFDLVISLGSTEHVSDFDAAMRELNRIIRPGGWLLIRWRSNKLWGSPYEYYNHNHYRFFTRTTWELALTRYGFVADDMSDREIEGNTGAEYIMARRVDTGSMDAVKDAIAKGTRDDADAKIAALKAYKTAFKTRCADFLAFADTVGRNPARIAQAVEAREVDYRLLWGAPEDTVPRALLEAERYVGEAEREGL